MLVQSRLSTFFFSNLCTFIVTTAFKTTSYGYSESSKSLPGPGCQLAGTYPPISNQPCWAIQNTEARTAWPPRKLIMTRLPRLTGWQEEERMWPNELHCLGLLCSLGQLLSQSSHLCTYPCLCLSQPEIEVNQFNQVIWLNWLLTWFSSLNNQNFENRVGSLFKNWT
jgi:hypothetical protein